MEGSRNALIVACYDYLDPGLGRLRAPVQDADALARVLRDPEIGGFDVHTLLNKPAHIVNEAVEEFFADRTRDDLLVLHFSCHGVKDDTGELYFATTNTKLRRLGATAVAADFVNRRMNRSRSQRIVLLLDCCYAGAFARGVVARAGAGVAIQEHFDGRGRAVLTASSAMEYAFEGDELTDSGHLRPSVFTSALVQGLETGEADRDQDGYVGLEELYEYIHDRVREATPSQTPGIWMFGVQGELHIARRSRPITTPALLAPELQEATDHPLARVRAAAVQELVALMQSRHAGQALAARLALERLRDDDSRMVSAAATAALVDASTPATFKPMPPRLEVSASVLNFGRLRWREQEPRQSIRLSNLGGGALNARAATSSDWLELRQEGSELVVSVDTTVVGDHQGVITVESDGGSAAIRVLVHVDPPLPTPDEAVTTTGREVAPEEGDRLQAEPHPEVAVPGVSAAALPVRSPHEQVSPADPWRVVRRARKRLPPPLVGVGALALVIAATVGVTVALQLNGSTLSSQQPSPLTGTTVAPAKPLKLRLVQDAVHYAGRIRLTASAKGQAGAAWSANRVDTGRAFRATFRFQISEPVDGGADGLAFVLQNNGASSIGRHGEKYGGGIGYHGLRQSLAIEFDTSKTQYPDFPMMTQGSGDPDGNHISIHTRGHAPNSADERSSIARTSDIPKLKDGRIHTAHIEYTPGRLDVYLDDLSRPALTTSLDIDETLGLADGKAWVGLTAATGGWSETHDTWPLHWQSQ